MGMKTNGLLGDAALSKISFRGLEEAFKHFRKKEFESLSERKRAEEVNRTLLQLIQHEKEPCFLLAPVLEFIEKIEKEKILDHYRFNGFELWLNQHSGLSGAENYRIRAKIAGKFVERSDYQVLFPIGMGKIYEGTHFVTAHKSPDLDTTIASFWGWIDAFAARVSDGLHVWNVPGGPPASQIEIDWIFRDLFGPAVFTHLPQHRTALSLTGADLVTQKGMVKKDKGESTTSILHDRDKNAVIIVDQEGFYLGDWRNIDVEQVRQVILLLSSCLRWFENYLHVHLIGLFAKPKLAISDIEPMLRGLFQMEVANCEPADDFSSQQKGHVDEFLKRVLHVKKGLGCSFEEFGVHLAKIGDVRFEGVDQILRAMEKAGLFDKKGALVEERPRIFTFLEKTIGTLHDAIQKIRGRLERLDIALKTKNEVFGRRQNFVGLRDDVEEIKSKMGSYSYLTVNHPSDQKLFPVGVIQATDIRKNVLGTVSLRDFCNREEMTIPSYLEIISVIDHHKSSLSTATPPFAIIADSQSSNSLVAAQAFLINDRYSLLGLEPKAIDAQLAHESKHATALATRLTQRLLQKRLIASVKSDHYVHPEREFIEYLHFLYGILDDTDLLSKVSSIDVECVASLLNRLKTLSSGKECEVVSLDDLPRDAAFPKKAAQRILQNEEMYSLYRKVYEYREKEVEQNIRLAAAGKASNLFADTKEQNGCCRIGQTKLFANNLSLFEEKSEEVRRVWLNKAMQVRKEKPEIDLHIHMISTIVSASEVYKGTQGKYAHKDEMWIWVPADVVAMEHLKRFLNSFQNSPGIKHNSLDVSFIGDNAEELSQAFKESFPPIPQRTQKDSLPIAVLRYNAGTLNSRKAMVSPFLPNLIS